MNLSQKGKRVQTQELVGLIEKALSRFGGGRDKPMLARSMKSLTKI